MNQEDATEKAAQVLGMDMVYQEAISIIIWLGEALDIEASDVSASLRILQTDADTAMVL